MPITIRPPEQSDAAALWQAARESVAEVSPWMSWCHAEYSVSDSEAWIERTIVARRDRAAFEFVILDADGTIAGACGINHINRVDGFANVSYWTRSSLAGRGIAPVAVSQLLAWGFHNTDFHRLEIVIAVENMKSQRVAEKLGAHREGTLRHRLVVGGRPSDAFIYSVLRFDKIPDLSPQVHQ